MPRLLDWFLGLPGPSRPPKTMMAGFLNKKVFMIILMRSGAQCFRARNRVSGSDFGRILIPPSESQLRKIMKGVRKPAA